MTAQKNRKISRNYTDPHHPRHAFSDFPSDKPAQKRPIKLVSYNIRFSKQIKRAVSLFLEHPQLQDADIICLQEMDPEGVNLFSKTFRYNYVYYPAVVHPHHNRDFGNAILSKWPIQEDHKIILPDTPRQRLQRIAVFSKISIHGKNIFIINVHMKVFMKPDRRSDQIDFVIRSLPSLAKHTIIAGDFNTFNKKHHRSILGCFSKAKFTHASQGIGWTHKHWTTLNRKHSLDHVFTKGFKPVESGKILHRKASDHMPIWTILKWS